VLDQATAMATLAAAGQRAPTHFVARVVKDSVPYYAEPDATVRAVDPAVAADVTAVLARHTSGQIPGGPPSASIAGSAPYGTSVLDTTHAWLIGYTPHLAVAVWVGNQEVEFPLLDAVGNRITGDTLPAEVYRALVAGATDVLRPGPTGFPEPADLGDPGAGDAPPPAATAALASSAGDAS
jgi:membrane peptidoglycan carboxypeptidase